MHNNRRKYFIPEQCTVLWPVLQYGIYPSHLQTDVDAKSYTIVYAITCAIVFIPSCSLSHAFADTIHARHGTQATRSTEETMVIESLIVI